MSDIPEHILAQIPALAAEGLPVGRISFLLRLSPDVIKAELRRLDLAVTTTNSQTEMAQGSWHAW